MYIFLIWESIIATLNILLFMEYIISVRIPIEGFIVTMTLQIAIVPVLVILIMVDEILATHQETILCFQEKILYLENRQEKNITHFFALAKENMISETKKVIKNILEEIEELKKEEPQKEEPITHHHIYEKYPISLPDLSENTRIFIPKPQNPIAP